MTTSTVTSSASFLTGGVQKTVLPNGLTLITKETHESPVVATMIWYRVGSRNEELGQTGKSHFLEHMLFKGTDRYKRGDIDLITLRNGGTNNAFTWLDFTAYYFTFASDRWQAALEIEANRMRKTNFSVHEFEHEKKVVEEELHIALDGPWEALENEVWATAFRQHPYHWPTVGWLEDLEAATAADMKAYYDKWYHPRNATLVVVGDFASRSVINKVKRLFGPIPPGRPVKPLHIVEPPQKGEKRVIVKKATPVERLVAAYHAPPVGHPHSYAMHVIEAVLSTGKSSRLYKRLIEQEQTVSTMSASYHDHIDPSLMYIQAELKPGVQLNRVERTINEEINRLRSERVTKAELERAKRQIEAEFVFSSEDPLQQAMLLGQFETIAVGDWIPEGSKGYRYLDTLLDYARLVTPEDIMRVAQTYFAEDNRTTGYLMNDDIAHSVSPDQDGGRAQLSHRLGSGACFRKRSGRDVPQKKSGKKAGGERRAVTVKVSNRRTSANQPASPRLDVERIELADGLVLLLCPNHSNPSVSINAIVSAGSRFEADAQAGLASFAGELLDEGTENRTSEQIADLAESVGARLTTFGDYQSSGVRASLLSKDVALGIDLVADVLTRPTFPEGRVKLHKERRIAQIRSRLDVPRVQASDLLNESVFKDHPQHRPPIGYETTVERLSRDDLAGFHRRYYTPSNTLIAITGDIDKSEVTALIQEKVAGWKSSTNLGLPAVPQPVLQTEAVETLFDVDKDQLNIFIGHVGIERRNADYYSLLVLDTILGSSPGFTSRIPRILRDEQGLAYHTYANITGSAGIDCGRFVAYIGTSPENMDKAVEGLRQEIGRIVSDPVSKTELDTAKAYLTGNFVFDFQTNSQIAEFLLQAEVYKLGFDYIEKYPTLIRAVTIEDVARVARTYIRPDRLTTVIVGPVKRLGRAAGAYAGD